MFNRVPQHSRCRRYSTLHTGEACASTTGCGRIAVDGNQHEDRHERKTPDLGPLASAHLVRIVPGASGTEAAMRTHAERLMARDGYFDPDSIVRRLGNSPVTPFLGGGAAVLLQVAHPLVAAGVVEHSGYDRDLWLRLVRTLRALYLITFGDTREADQAGASVQAVHARVHGTTTEPLGRFPAGTHYSASDPELMLWVHATLVHSSLAAYERFVRPLSRSERDRYVLEMNLVAELFGVPPKVLPTGYSAFRRYFAAQLAGETITVTEPARRVAAVIMATPVPAPLRLLVPAHRLATVRLLPPRLRREYQLRWSRYHEAVLPLAGLGMRYGTAPALRLAARMRLPRNPLTA